jgi:hypothetical protein
MQNTAGSDPPPNPSREAKIPPGKASLRVLPVEARAECARDRPGINDGALDIGEHTRRPPSQGDRLDNGHFKLVRGGVRKRRLVQRSLSA